MKICKGWLQALLSAAPRGFAARSHVLARPVSLDQTGELARRLALDGKGCRDLRPLIRSLCKGVLKQDNEWKEELSCVT